MDILSVKGRLPEAMQRPEDVSRPSVQDSAGISASTGRQAAGADSNKIYGKRDALADHLPAARPARQLIRKAAMSAATIVEPTGVEKSMDRTIPVTAQITDRTAA